MGRVRIGLVKRAAKEIIEKYYSRLTYDFDSNKRVADEVASIPSKRLRNKISGTVTHLMKRIRNGPVRGISLKLQEEERERRMDFIPERSSLDLDEIKVDEHTFQMLTSLGLAIQGVSEDDTAGKPVRKSDKPRGPRAPRADKAAAPAQ